MTILYTEPYMVHIYVPVYVWIILAISLIGMFIYGCFRCSKNSLYCGIFCIVLSCVLALICVVYADEYEQKGNRYYVTFDADYELDADKYVIEEQKGNLFIIKDKVE